MRVLRCQRVKQLQQLQQRKQLQQLQQLHQEASEEASVAEKAAASAYRREARSEGCEKVLTSSNTANVSPSRMLRHMAVWESRQPRAASEPIAAWLWRPCSMAMRVATGTFLELKPVLASCITT